MANPAPRRLFTQCCRIAGFIAILLFTGACGDARDWHKFSGESTVTVVTPDVSEPAPDTQTPPDNEPTEGECVEAEDCLGSDPCVVTALCVNNQCVDPIEIPCDAGMKCKYGECRIVQTECAIIDDQDLCTVDSCDSLKGKSVHTPKSCVDQNELTIDSCDKATGDCSHVYDCGNCSDENPCTIEQCDPKVGCEHIVHECPTGYTCNIDGGCSKHCGSDSDCADELYCTIDSCDEEYGACENRPRTCDDQSDLTEDSCNPNPEDPTKGACVNNPTECPDGCDDGDPCTDDFCVEGQCKPVARECGTDTACSPTTGKCEISLGCLSDEKCDDGNACTADNCENGSCTHDQLDLCEEGELCDSVKGGCFKLDECPEGCPDDGDKCTVEVCIQGECKHKGGPSACGGATAFNSLTCQCENYAEAPECVDGQKTCLELGGAGTLSWVGCFGGKYWPISTCGSKQFNTCSPVTGCSSIQSLPQNPPNQCLPSCSGKSCGDNGCGGSCGTCGAGSTCNASGLCAAPSTVDQLVVTWIKPTNGLPSSIAKAVLATECKKGNSVLVSFRYLPTDSLAIVVPISSSSATFMQTISGLSGSTCKANVFFYDANNAIVTYAVKDVPITKLGDLSVAYNGFSNSNVPVGSNGQGGGDYMWPIP